MDMAELALYKDAVGAFILAIIFSGVSVAMARKSYRDALICAGLSGFLWIYGFFGTGLWTNYL